MYIYREREIERERERCMIDFVDYTHVPIRWGPNTLNLPTKILPSNIR